MLGVASSASLGCWLVQPYSMTCCGIWRYLPVRLTTPTNVSFWTFRSVGAVVYCVREVVFLLPTLFSLSVVKQVQMWLIAVDDSFLWACWMLAGNKKGRKCSRPFGL